MAARGPSLQARMLSHVGESGCQRDAVRFERRIKANPEAPVTAAAMASDSQQALVLSLRRLNAVLFTSRVSSAGMDRATKTIELAVSKMMAAYPRLASYQAPTLGINSSREAQDMLMKLPFLSEVEDSSFIKELSKYLCPRTTQHGECICREGEPGRDMFLIRQGRFNVFCGPSAVPIAHLGSGDHFGQVSPEI